MRAMVRRNPESGLARQQGPSLTRWDPWSEFNRLRSQMDSLFEGMFAQPGAAGEPLGGFTPAVDLWENDNEYFLNAYLPGLSQEDIQVEVVGNTVHVHGEAKPKVPEKEATVHVSQGSYGQFDARYSLPTDINAEKVEANYRNGVLELKMPKAESVKPRAIPVNIQS